MGIIDEMNKGIPVGTVLTIEEHFKYNPQSIHVINGDPNRKGVMLNGHQIEIGSKEWEMIKNIQVYHDNLFQELRILYKRQDKK